MAPREQVDAVCDVPDLMSNHIVESNCLGPRAAAAVLPSMKSRSTGRMGTPGSEGRQNKQRGAASSLLQYFYGNIELGDDQGSLTARHERNTATPHQTTHNR